MKLNFNKYIVVLLALIFFLTSAFLVLNSDESLNLSKISTFFYAEYLGRIMGVSAFLMFTFNMCLGVLMTSKLLVRSRLVMPYQILEAHQFNGTYIAITFMLLHVSSFFFNPIMAFEPIQILVPFLYDPTVISANGYNLRLASSIGILAFYLALIIIGSSILRKKLVSTKVWRKLHYLNFLFYVMILVHGFMAGANSNELWLRIIFTMSLTVVSTLTIFRIFFGKKYFLSRLAAQQQGLQKNLQNT